VIPGRALERARERLEIVRSARALIESSGLSHSAAAARLGVHPATLRDWMHRESSGGLMALVDGWRGRSQPSDLAAEILAVDWFLAAARYFYLHTNRARGAGSVREAVMRVISLPNVPRGWSAADTARFLKILGMDEVPSFPEDLREVILERLRAGQRIVPATVARLIAVSRQAVAQFRDARQPRLDFSAPGSAFFVGRATDGNRHAPRPGELIEADDATINFPVVIPWELGGCDCSNRYRVKVGRFQLLVAMDVASRFITAFAYVVRPRSSYRAEDILTLMKIHAREHGLPRAWRFEQGIWKSQAVRNAAQMVGTEIVHTYSPRQKPFIEGLFNALWTKLSVQFPGVDLGRYRGETPEVTNLLIRAQRGAIDPRAIFPPIDRVVEAIIAVVAEKNSTPVDSDIGRWIPVERWETRARGHDFDESLAWVFAPFQKNWRVRGLLVGGRVKMFDDLSVPFDFAAEWLPRFDGARVRAHFDPWAADASATLVLDEPFNGLRRGDVLGRAEQVNEIAGYARLAMRVAAPSERLAGREVRAAALHALRREVRAVAGRKSPVSQSDARDGFATAARVEREAPAPARRGGGDQGESATEISADRIRRADLMESELAP
jgi:DNA-binding transcriptional regulator YdaS (Cro superfamily)